MTATVLRPEALCNGKIIGIEYIFSIKNGMQINIPGKTEYLRKKGQNNELFCPCGCGANLELVAGEKGIRAQHFRIKKSSSTLSCSYTMQENKTSIKSKILLKGWLEENLNAPDIDCRVPICSLNDSNRKYEFSFLSKEKGIALNYCYDLEGLTAEKISILDDNSSRIKIIYIVDITNRPISSQYPEKSMRVQNKQGYCLFLDIMNKDYSSARLIATYYWKNLYGFWEERLLIDGFLKDYYCDDNTGLLFYNSISLTERLNIEKKKIEEEEKELEENRERELKRRQIEKERLQKEREELRRKQENETKALSAYQSFQYGKRSGTDSSRANNPDPSHNNTNQHSFGRLLYTCKYCNRIGNEDIFSEYSQVGEKYIGVCKKCSRNNPDYKKEIIKIEENAKNNSRTCPYCKGKLVIKRKKDGTPFVGCSNFPQCHFCRKIYPIENISDFD